MLVLSERTAHVESCYETWVPIDCDGFLKLNIVIT